MLHAVQDHAGWRGLPDWKMVTSIFVQIPAYRDFELPETIADAVAKASGLNFLTFGVHSCVLSGDNITAPATPDWARIVWGESPAPGNIGLQLSRHIANSFYRNEDYYLQIDSHMRFVQDWDIKLIAMHRFYVRMGIPKPMISMYPPTYTLEDGQAVLHRNEPFYATRISFAEHPEYFAATYIPSQQATPAPDGCVYTSSVSGGFVFTDGSFAELTPNKLIAFWGEEILIAARAFTSGFDLVTATEDTVFHLYHSGQPYEKTHRHHVWNDFPTEFAALDAISKAEIQRVFSDRVVGAGALGGKRTLEEYEKFAGLDFRAKTVTQEWR